MLEVLRLLALLTFHTNQVGLIKHGWESRWKPKWIELNGLCDPAPASSVAAEWGCEQLQAFHLARGFAGTISGIAAVFRSLSKGMVPLLSVASWC